MKLAIFLLTLFSACFCFSIMEQSANASTSILGSKDNLRFPEITGRDVNDTVIRNFVLIVNNASMQFGNSVSLNAIYIKKQMDRKYGE